MPFHILRVDLRDDQRHIGVHAECGGVIHKYRTGLYDRGGKLLGDIVFRCAQHDIHALEGLVTGKLDGHILTLEFQGLARAAGAGQGNEFSNREISLLQNFDHFLSYSAGGTQNSNCICFHNLTSHKEKGRGGS